MNIVHDAEITIHDFNLHPATFRVRIWEGAQNRSEPQFVVVMSETPDNPGTSITNAVELVATRVWTMLGCPSPAEVIFYEHYPQTFIPTRHGKPMQDAETFDRVIFTLQNGGLVVPRWYAANKEKVEQEIGGKVEEENTSLTPATD